MKRSRRETRPGAAAAACRHSSWPWSSTGPTSSAWSRRCRRPGPRTTDIAAGGSRQALEPRAAGGRRLRYHEFCNPVKSLATPSPADREHRRPADRQAKRVRRVAQDRDVEVVVDKTNSQGYLPHHRALSCRTRPRSCAPWCAEFVCAAIYRSCAVKRPIIAAIASNSRR
ncbi:hypothetical protein EJB05_55857 [Eragrostis curvula]|uniref:Uncharacterized protein n=1 Tax=Eragrostis curvula TaxID=38414 RepID=A0A5J9SHP8_9POAL|nr:hypothetical protein EJB05_55857 [Eragrostis curvula]